MRASRRARLVGLSMLSQIACGPGPVDVDVPRPALELPPLATGAIAIVGANVVPMNAPGVLTNRTLIVRDGRIAALGPADAVQVPSDAERIEGEGMWVIPGLTDMHVHLRRADLPAYRQAGITMVRSMWGTPGVAALQAEAAAGADHPTIFSASPGIDGSPPAWPYTVVVHDVETAREEVRRLAAEGWQFIKVYNRLSPAVHAAILDEARTVGVPVVGHVPFAVDLDDALERGQASIEHLTGIGEDVAGGRTAGSWVTMDFLRLSRVAGRLARSKTAVCPTLVVLRHIAVTTLAPDAAATARDHQGTTVLALHRAGVPLLAGTDAGIDIVPAGSSLAEELMLFVQAGLTPYEALRVATAEAARFLGVDDEMGTIEVGKRADLVLLAADPLANMAAITAPVGLIQRGARLF